jgi:hypothetical protein
MKTGHILLGVGVLVGGGLLLYFKPWRKKSTDYLNLTEAEKREITYLMEGGLNYSYDEALEQVLRKRLEYKGSLGWS